MKPDKRKIAVVGAGGVGREVMALLKTLNDTIGKWDIIGFFDDSPKREKINGYDIVGTIEDLNLCDEETDVVVAIGNPKIKKQVIDHISNPKVEYPSLVHPSAIFYDRDSIHIGRGVIVGANTVLTVNIRLDDFCFVHNGVLLSHDVHIGKYSTLMPSVCISAGAGIGEAVYLGNGVKIDAPVKVEAGSVVEAGKIISTKDS